MLADLTSAFKETIGLDFIASELQTDSPYGAALKRALWENNGQQRLTPDQLREEYNNIALLIRASEVNGTEIASIRELLRSFKDITNIVRKLAESALGIVELFELKVFLLNLAQLYPLWSSLTKQFGLLGLPLEPLEQPLDTLDPLQRRLALFAVDETFAPELVELRRRKSAILRESGEEHQQEYQEIVQKELAIEEAVTADLTIRLRPFGRALRLNLDSIAHFDLLLQKALLARKHGAIAPTIGGESLVLTEMHNTAVAAALHRRGLAFTPLSIEMQCGVTLLTGANMGGKSVAIRTVLLNVCLALSGFFVFATEASIPYFEEIHLLAEDQQSFRNGLSTFGAEVATLNAIIAGGARCFSLIALDEIARGTNPHEGAQIVRGVASYLGKQPCMTLLATHYDGVAQVCGSHYRVLGLKKSAEELLREHDFSGTLGIELLAEQMDYRIARQGQDSQPAREALTVCALLGMNEELLKEIEAAGLAGGVFPQC